MALTACGVAGLQSVIAHPFVGVPGEIPECDPLRFSPLLQPRQPRPSLRADMFRTPASRLVMYLQDKE